jgi:2'-5' RNA ligase
LAKPPAAGRRLFFALWPDPVLKASIGGAARLPARAVSGRRVRDENLHLTVLFLGSVAAEAEARLAQAAGAVRAGAFDLALDRVGGFFRSRVLWIGPSQPPAELAELRRQLEVAAKQAAVAFDPKPLVPHVTCYRDVRQNVKKGTQPFSRTPVPRGKGLRPLFDIAPLRWPVRGFALVHSTPGAKPEYHVVSQWPLQTVS